ncbi:MAG: hypothetical protein QOJ86_5338 [Bradyrhizobium sp.]|jgi:hypothetical protein|nr:hypothetical protein [Bradyrhizobium sp.]
MGQRMFGFQNGGLRHLLGRLAASGFALLIGCGSAFAQSGDLRTQDQSGKPAATNPATPADAAKDSQRKTDEFVEASQAINGPAGNPECVWLGRRVVVLMWRDDLDTAFRHLDLYDRFGCPGGHVQATFRCLVRFGAIDPKVPETLNGRVHACWINPGAQPQTAAAAQPAPPSTAGAASPATAGAAAPAAAPAAPAAAPAK